MLERLIVKQFELWYDNKMSDYLSLLVVVQVKINYYLNCDEAVGSYGDKLGNIFVNNNLGIKFINFFCT